MAEGKSPGLASSGVESGPGSRGPWTSCLLLCGPQFVPLSNEGQLCPKPCLSLCSEHSSRQDQPTLGSTDTVGVEALTPIASVFLPTVLRKSPKSCERETDESQIVVPREFGCLCIAEQSRGELADREGWVLRISSVQ